MRYLYAAILLVFLGAVGLFAIQNVQTISVGFLKWSVTAPLALVIVASYLLGMVSGWSVMSFVRATLHRVSGPPRAR